MKRAWVMKYNTGLLLKIDPSYDLFFNKSCNGPNDMNNENQ